MQSELDAAAGILAAFAVIVGVFSVVGAVTWCVWRPIHREDEKQ